MPRTLEIIARGLTVVPTDIAWSLIRLGESLGRQQLFFAQAPQKLKALKEHAIVESAVSSNRIEGIEVEGARVGTLVFGNAAAANRNEEEIRGYRTALNWIHTDESDIKCTEENILKLHSLVRGDIFDSGKYKEHDGDIIERYSSVETRVRFKTVSASQTPPLMAKLDDLWNRFTKEQWAPPLIGIASYNLDFLCIHPFRDGNGRVSRLLLLLQCYQAGFKAGRYISIERIIEQNKERYYETLEVSSQGWHDGRHDPWPYTRFILFVLKEAYREFESRVGTIGEPKGAKTEAILSTIKKRPGSFTVAALRAECPQVSLDMIRRVLKDLQADGRIICLGRGPSAAWKKTERW